LRIVFDHASFPEHDFLREIAHIHIQSSYIIVDQKLLKKLDDEGINYKYAIDPKYISLYPIMIEKKYQRRADRILEEFPPSPIKSLCIVYLVSEMHLKALDVSRTPYKTLSKI